MDRNGTHADGDDHDERVEQSASGAGQTISVGKCPNCGYVCGDDLDYRFPNPSECRVCGEETEKTTVTSEETVRSLTEDGTDHD